MLNRKKVKSQLSQQTMEELRLYLECLERNESFGPGLTHLSSMEEHQLHKDVTIELLKVNPRWKYRRRGE